MKCTRTLLAILLSLVGTAAGAQDRHEHPVSMPGSDGRTVLELSPAERAMILDEMRRFLDGVATMTGALGRQDMPAAAEAARGLGLNMTHDVPPALRAKLPPAFRQLGFSVHRDFDQIALDADSLKDVSHSLGQLSATLQKCVSCHSTYQIRPNPMTGADHTHP